MHPGGNTAAIARESFEWPHYATTMELKYFASLQTHAIAQKLDRSDDTIRQYLQYGQRLLGASTRQVDCGDFSSAGKAVA